MKNTNQKSISKLKRSRVLVFRSNQSIYCQLFDIDNKKVILSASTLGNKEKLTPAKKARMLGKQFSEELKKHKVDRIIFDRNKYAYHGQIKEVAEGLREGGIKF